MLGQPSHPCDTGSRSVLSISFGKAGPPEAALLQDLWPVWEQTAASTEAEDSISRAVSLASLTTSNWT